MKYTTIEDIEGYSLTDIHADYEPTVLGWIESVSRQFDQIANRKLVADEEESGGEPEYRFFDGQGGPWLAIDDCVEVQRVDVGENFGASLLETESFNPYPQAAPFRRLYRTEGWPVGVQNIRVAARWGYLSELPADLKLAATIIVSGIINAQRPGVQAKKSEKIGNYAVVYSDEKGVDDYDTAMATLEKYKKYEL